LALLVEPQKLLVKLLLAPLEIGQLLLNGGTQLLEILGSVVGERSAERRYEVRSPEKECRRARSSAVLHRSGD
jgi:hypothetical protein